MLAGGNKLIDEIHQEGDDQQLLLIVRENDGFVRRVLEGVRFVPLLSGALA